MIAAEPGRRQDLEPDVAGIEHVEIAQLAGRVRQRRSATGTDEHRDPEDLGDGLGARGVVRVDVGQGDRLDGAAAAPRQGQRADRAPGPTDRPDRRARTDADRRDRRDTGWPATPPPARHDDPGDPVARPRRPRSGRAVPAPAGRGSPRSSGRARAAGGSCSSAATSRADPRPSPRARPSGATTRGPRPRRPRTSASAPAGRVAAKNLASNRRGIDGGVTQRDSGTSRSVRSRRSRSRRPARPGSSRRARSAERAAPIRASRPGSDRADVGQQHARLLEQLADRGDVGGVRRPRREVAAERRGRLGRRDDRPRDERGCAIGRIDPAAGEDVRRPARTPSSPVGASGGPRARPSPSRSSTTVAAGRGSTGPFGHAASAIGDRRQRAPSRSAAGSVTGRRQTKPRQT